MVLTFEKPRVLTYFEGEKEVKTWGVLALAVKTHPYFSVRDCSTFHQFAPQNQVEPLEYKLVHKAINDMLHKGVKALIDYFGQGQGVIPARGE